MKYKPVKTRIAYWFHERGSERQKSEHRKVRTSKVKNYFQFSDFTYGVKKDQNVENKKINYLRRITYVYQGLWGVSLGSIRLG
jgi:hypothetical protein